MSFTLKCDECGHQQVLETEKFKERNNIDFLINDGWEGTAEVIIACKNCENEVYDDKEYRTA